MESKAMRKFVCILLPVLALAFTSCQKKWTSEVELGVFSTRINLEQEADNFVVTVFSNQGWTAAVADGSSWISIKEDSGNALGYIHASSSDNFDDYARVGKLKLTSASGKEIIVNIVQSGSLEKASDVPDSLL